MKSAELEWIDGRPYSKQFGDIYFSKEGGLAETQYVFLQHNNLPERWQHHNLFTMIEIGFGTGLNFLATWQAWQKHAPEHAQLHYIAIEQFPLKLQDMARALEAYPELNESSQNLLQAYPPIVEGFYPIVLPDKSVRLTLIFGDANEVLPQLMAKADAWYLDGFAPKKNPELWHDKIFQNIANLSQAGASFATFTAVGRVRRGLEQAGFAVEKTKGYGPKKEMLHGYFTGLVNPLPLAPWFALSKPTICPGKIAVIGGGIAGISCAYALIKRGYEVDLYEANTSLAGAASSNPRALLKPQISPNFNLADQFYTEGFFYTSHIIQDLKATGLLVDADLQGLIQLACNESLQTRIHKVVEKRNLPKEFVEYVDQATAEKLAGIPLSFGGLYFPTAGAVNLSQLCQVLVKACGDKLKVHTKQCISKLQHNGQYWELYNSSSNVISTSEIIIMANAAQAKQLDICTDYSLSPLPGQLSMVASSVKSQALKIPLSYEGHIIPAKNGTHFIGTTYRHGREQDLTESERDHQVVEGYLNKIAPTLGLDFSSANAWVNSRSVTPDHMPLVGPIANKAQFMQAYEKLAWGNTRFEYPRAEYWPNLYISAGHGSKGLSSSLLSAEIIACLIQGTGLPISAKVYQAIHPSRFWLRQLKKL